MNDETLELDRLIAGIDSRIAMRTGAQRYAAKQLEYDRARAAAIVWTDWHDAPTPAKTVERLQRHAVDLAAEEPTLEITWLHPAARSTQLVGRQNAVAMPGRGLAICPPIIGEVEYVGRLHELGHLRDSNRHGRNVIERETFAWSWARKRAVIWNRACQDTMAMSLDSYLKAATCNDLPSVLEAERLLNPMLFRQELVRPWRAGQQ